VIEAALAGEFPHLGESVPSAVLLRGGLFRSVVDETKGRARLRTGAMNPSARIWIPKLAEVEVAKNTMYL
jgi:hypothetical protein